MFAFFIILFMLTLSRRTGKFIEYCVRDSLTLFFGKIIKGVFNHKKSSKINVTGSHMTTCHNFNIVYLLCQLNVF